MDNYYNLFLKQLNDNMERHSHNVAKISSSIAEKMGLDKERAYKIGLVHDIGKIYIPSRILKKNEKISGLEREIIDLHSYFGYQLLREKEEPDEIALPVLYHHGFEKPKLKPIEHKKLDEEMMIYISLIHSVDIYDAMTSNRPYHSPEAIDKVIEELKDDKLCNDILLNYIEKEDYILKCV